MNNSLTIMRPQLAAEWSERNLPLTPDDVTYGSNKLYWWKGSCGHEWQSSAKARSAGEQCPICSNARIIPGINDLESIRPDLVEEWSFKNELQPSEIGPGSHKKVLWRGNCGHEWSASVRSRVKGTGCPYCSHNLVLPGFNDLETLFPDVAKEWSPKNLPELPSQVTAFRNKKKWWRCKKGHEWYSLISTRSYGSQCPYCSGIELLPGFNDFQTRFPKIAEEWSDRNGSLLPSQINERSTKNVWWKCSTCGYEYRAVIKARAHGLMCPVCAERAVLPGYNDLQTTDPEIAIEWDVEKNGSLTPNHISRCSLKPVWWKGTCGHSWKDKIFHRTGEHAGCIYCEGAFQKALPELLVLFYARRKRLQVRLKDEQLLGTPVDAYIPDLKLVFVFPHKGTSREQNVTDVIQHLCGFRGVHCEVISAQKPADQCMAIKQGFATTHTYIYSDNESDVKLLRERFMKRQQEK